ncbi:MAG: hypothetical protein WD267_05890 [Balneolales bacterium]
MLKSIVLTIGLLSCSSALFAQPEPPLGYEPHLIQSLFTEDHRNNDYDNALKWGRYLVEAHPKEMPTYQGTYRGDRNFRRMIDIYTFKAGETSDPTLRSANLDSVQIMYDKVFEHFEDGEIDKFRWLQLRGRFFQENASYIEDGYDKAYQDYYAMFQLNSQRATELSDGYYVQITLTDLERNGNQEKALEMIETAEPYASPKLITFFEETRNSLYSDPDERIVYLEEKLSETPNDLELMEELRGLYEQVNNKAKAKQYAMLLYEKAPTYDNIMRLVDDALSNAEYNTAIEYLKESLSKTNDSRKQRATALQISDNYLNLRNLQEAKNYAQRAIQYDSNWGQPYIKIAEIYGQAVSSCAGSEMTRQDKVVYWLVLDYLDKARSADQSAARTVNRLYSSYQGATPTREEMFYAGWDDGQKIMVDGSLKECYAWINEETAARSR